MMSLRTDAVQYPLATRESSISLAKDLSEKLPRLAKGLARKHGKTQTARKEYTKAVWRYFEDMRKVRGWAIWPKNPPTGGRVRGEYLTDFSLCDERLGYRIACESEWGNYKCVEWAFDKLRAVKADTKILIFQDKHSDDGGLPQKFETLFRHNLAECGHHHPGHEFYLFVQFDGEKPRLWLWEPTECGPFDEKQSKDKVIFEPIK